MNVPTPVHADLHRIAVTGIVWKLNADGTRRYLITKRSPHKKAWPNKWTVPGGGLETEDYLQMEAAYQNSESPQWYDVVERTLKREIKEEVGLEVEDEQLLHNVAFIRPDGLSVIVFSYFCKYKSGEVKLDLDATDYAWVTAAEVSNYELIQGIDKEIELADKKLKEKQINIRA